VPTWTPAVRPSTAPQCETGMDLGAKTR
jgi:hypothetical protein